MKRVSYNTILAIAAVLIVGFDAEAQRAGDTRVNLNYNLAFPTGSLQDFTSKATGRAWNVNLLYGASDRLAIGVEVGYRNFYESLPREVYVTEDGSQVSAVLTNTVEVLPLLAKARYFFSEGGKTRPFVSVGAGVNFATVTQYAGEFTNATDNKIGFAAIPEAGVYIPVGKNGNVGITLAASYAIMPYDFGTIDNLNHAAAQIGVIVPLRR